MPAITIPQGLTPQERDRQILQAFVDYGPLPDTDFPAHCRPAVWILRAQGYLTRTGSLYSITPAGEARLDALNEAAENPPE